MVSPGEKADIQVGDVILKINGEKIKEMEDVKPFVKEAGKENKELTLTVKRDNETIETTLDPAKMKRRRIPHWIVYTWFSSRNWNDDILWSRNQNYGALGHVISDMDTQKPIEIHNGSIVRSNVTSIEKAMTEIQVKNRQNSPLKIKKKSVVLPKTALSVFSAS